MSSVFDSIMQQVSGDGLGQMGQSLGLSESDVAKVVGGAVPALLGGLNRNSGSVDGASSLLSALDRDHDGSILDDVAGFLGSSGSADAGAGILRHTFGGRQEVVETALSSSSGVDAASVGKILAMVAPLVMGALGKQRRESQLDADGLAGLLGQEQEQVRQQSPQAVDLFTRLLDGDNDGNVMDDIAQKGAGLLGKLLG